jgi:hypothetical protein
MTEIEGKTAFWMWLKEYCKHGVVVRINLNGFYGSMVTLFTHTTNNEVQFINFTLNSNNSQELKPPDTTSGTLRGTMLDTLFTRWDDKRLSQWYEKSELVAVTAAPGCVVNSTTPKNWQILQELARLQGRLDSPDKTSPFASLFSVRLAGLRHKLNLEHERGLISLQEYLLQA